MKQNRSSVLLHAGLFGVAAVGLAIGLLLILLPVSTLLKIIFIIAGAATVLYHLPGFVSGLANINKRTGQVTLILSTLSLILGVVMIFHHSTVLMVILGIYLLVLPTVQILLAQNRSLQLKTELPKIILGIVLILIGPGRALEILFDVAGWLITILTVAYVVGVFVSDRIRQKRANHTTGNRVFVDHDGDGSVDSVIVDTTGDGKPDTEKPYRNRK